MSDADLVHYLSAVTQGHVMLDEGLITVREFRLFEEKMRAKYHLPDNSIYRDDRLICRRDQR